LHSILRESVERQLVADVPLGIFLSGGVDSSLIAAISSKIRPDLETLTIGFEHKAYDESDKAKEYAKILRLKNTRIILSEKELLSIFEEHNSALTEPIADYSTLPTFLISKLAASRFKVMLSGDGGDELFWGYPRFRTFARSAPMFNLPGSSFRRVAGRTLKSCGFDITGFLNEESLGKANLAFHSYLSQDFLENIWPDSKLSEELLGDFSFKNTKRESVLLYLRRNEFYQHLQKILIKVDRMSMANGLEVRVPLLDKAVLRHAQTILPGMLKDHIELKWLLKNILQQYLPEGIIEQQKKGFTPPLKIWAKTTLRNHIEDTLEAGMTLGIPFKNTDMLLEYAKSYLGGKHNNLEGLWTIYVLIKWRMQLG
jgi:asparagine synthase (glutamine-hydrolysing)